MVDKSDTGLLEGVRRALYINILVCSAISLIVLALTIAALSRYQRQLSQAESRRYEMLCALSHDIRSPHSSILALIETENLQANPPRLTELLCNIKRYAVRALEMAEGFIQLARAETHDYKFELADIGKLLIDASDEIWPQAKQKNIRISIPTCETAYYAYVDRDLMTRVFINLLSNAIKYSPPQASVACRIECYEDRGKYIRCAIQDNGYGIAPQHQTRLFEKFSRFHTVDQPGAEGTGLGLAFVRAVIHGHNGNIRVESAPNTGTTFTISLPVFH
ncbi:integral membrane sensor signal transduction histidine kinase [Caballeronia calidae]|uniref:histidine kinase n=2 Tax=Caballeronia calidae TaxID=1777139 RepID=A0A158EK24_9BURK|nr:integral membrane sensor signal transduction histidine kinase [Caballeronia calidae]